MRRIIFGWILGVAAAYAQGNAAAGKDLYMKFNCYACHGFSGQNGSGARLVPMKLTQPAFTAFVHKGRAGMPPYSAKVIADAQLGDVYAYLKTLPDLTPAAKSIPALSQILNEN